MPSFLTTSSMPPALRARIEAALVADLRQRTLFPKRRTFRKVVRVALALASVGLVWLLVTTYRQSRLEVERQRAVTLAAFQRIDFVSAAQKSRIAALGDALVNLAVPAGPEADLGNSKTLASLSARRLLYVRGDARSLPRLAGARASARDSSLDAFAICLVAPPANLRESTLLRAIARKPPGGRVHALSEALMALDFLGSSFPEEVRNAQHMQELRHLDARLRRPALQEALSALDAEVLFVVLDEEKAPGSVADFDGEASHDLRMHAIEIASGKTLWRKRAHVDPSWISDKSRLAYSRALDSCRLACELSETCKPPAP
jgi:hypothetical protein